MTVREYFRTRERTLLLASIVLIPIAAAAIWWALAVLRPLPPRMVVMATGPPGGAYAELGTRYREILAREGFELRLLPTAGALENLTRLRDPRSGVSVGFVQAGSTSADESPDLTSLGTICYEPLWFFFRGIREIRAQADLRGKRISIGPEGSGTRALMLNILALNGIGEGDAELLPFVPERAKEKLLQGEIDAAAMVASWESPVVRQLLTDQNLNLINFPRAVDLPLSEDARHFYKSGPPFLQRYLPFLLAVLVERLLILLTPLVGVVYPLVRYLPMIYQGVMRRRIFRLYGELKLLEIQLVKARAGQDIDDLLSRLDHLETRVNHLRLPVIFMPMLYSLRSHVQMARQRLEKLPAGNEDRTPPAGGAGRGGGKVTDKSYL